MLSGLWTSLGTFVTTLTSLFNYGPKTSKSDGYSSTCFSSLKGHILLGKETALEDSTESTVSSLRGLLKFQRGATSLGDSEPGVSSKMRGLLQRIKYGASLESKTILNLVTIRKSRLPSTSIQSQAELMKIKCLICEMCLTTTSAPPHSSIQISSPL